MESKARKQSRYLSHELFFTEGGATDYKDQQDVPVEMTLKCIEMLTLYFHMYSSILMYIGQRILMVLSS